MHIRFVRPLLLCAALTLPVAVACNGDDGKTDTDSNAVSESGEQGCTPGELNCECNAGQCLGDLECVQGMCVSSCIPGELGCECNAGQCLGELECVNDLCTDPNCTPGELACECNNGQCLGDLECVDNLCSEGSGDGDGDTTGDGDGDTAGDGDGDGDGDPVCPNPNEMMCDGECIDVMANDDNCGGCGVECVVKLGEPPIGSCVEGACSPTWSDCVLQTDGYETCDEICALEGKTCVTQGCNGDTFLMQGDLNSCAEGIPSQTSQIQCDGLIGWQQPAGACCCAQ
jgi:hypothetical protein